MWKNFDILSHWFLRLLRVKPMTTPEFKFYCSHCDQPLKCETQFAGRQIQCPACQHLIRIPNPPAGTGFTHVAPESGRTWDTHMPKGKKE
jgi:DNA-directed RNA polymerase subunit RPC12/RpoP